MRKRIIICCDGTWQSSVNGKDNIPSNITRLCRAINSIGIDSKDHKPWQQIVWYDSGVGTTSAGMMSTGIEGALGEGLEGNIIEAYNFCVLNWNPGDQVMCFGFSRGAYTARAIAGLISDIGICSKTDIGDFPELWKMYKKTKLGGRFYGSDAYYDYHDGKPADPQPEEQPWGEIVWESTPRGQWASTPESREVEVVGVFDTVGALGFPEVLGYRVPSWLTWTDKPEWHNVGLSPNINNAFQALALDEHRRAFTPTIFYVPTIAPASDTEIKEQKEVLRKAYREWSELVTSHRPAVEDLRRVAKVRNEAARKLLEMEDSKTTPPNLVQVWFPGFHIHIGGGSKETLKNQGNMEEMSNIAFSWMLDQIKEYISINDDTLRSEQWIRQDRLDRFNNALKWHNECVERRKAESWGEWLKRNGQWAVSSIRHPLTQAYREERSYGWGTGDLPDSFGVAYVANGSKTRTPGRYALGKDDKKLGETFEYIHPTVGFRVDQTAKHSDTRKHYRPIWLTGDRYDRRPKKSGKGYEYWFKYNGTSSYEVLPEWPIAAHVKSYERLAIQGPAAFEVVRFNHVARRMSFSRHAYDGFLANLRYVGVSSNNKSGAGLWMNNDFWPQIMLDIW
ncbi:T6SS phospholipase effector Tle1-like catalytic domain-containing protein [Aspergillus alliaceus]|uniref:T6SS phospholipase effector Tle1-like catalytic domain-containing protein n=1 Tax=Petromyces alliaceus TaxID=209559 RepID=UPI0012A3B1E7|nr:uncharacterized protein BDW43DRAFT_302139 [Aspergillus alliaceus]KAB8230815.1 hypothetical protein BDW43DRAFT_302139 [Aspergillus alliaceus]